MNGDHYMCASVGDSSVFMDGPGGVVELTLGKRRKPRIGSGGQDPVVTSRRVAGALLLTSDGLPMPPETVFALLRGKLDGESSVDVAKMVTDSSKQHGLFDDLAVVVVDPPEKFQSV